MVTVFWDTQRRSWQIQTTVVFQFNPWWQLSNPRSCGNISNQTFNTFSLKRVGRNSRSWIKTIQERKLLKPPLFHSSSSSSNTWTMTLTTNLKPHRRTVLCLHLTQVNTGVSYAIAVHNLKRGHERLWESTNKLRHRTCGIGKWWFLSRNRRFGATPFVLLVPTASSTNRNVPESSTSCPITPTSLAKVPRLREAVVVEVAKLGVGGFTPRALQSSFLGRNLGPIRHQTGPDWACSFMNSHVRVLWLLRHRRKQLRTVTAISLMLILLLQKERKREIVEL